MPFLPERQLPPVATANMPSSNGGFKRNLGISPDFVVDRMIGIARLLFVAQVVAYCNAGRVICVIRNRLGQGVPGVVRPVERSNSQVVQSGGTRRGKTSESAHRL